MRAGEADPPLWRRIVGKELRSGETEAYAAILDGSVMVYEPILKIPRVESAACGEWGLDCLWRCVMVI